MSKRPRPYELIVLGASGFTGRQLVQALERQNTHHGLRVALAGRRPEKLEALQSPFDVLKADADDPVSLAKLAASGRVLLNLAGPYALRGEAVIAACLDAGTHHLDLSGEVFWMRQMLHKHHARAVKRGVLLVPACGYEALPFDLAMLAAAESLQARSGQKALQLDVAVQFTGKGLRRLSDTISGGTLASMGTVLQHDRSDSLQRMDCLLPEVLPEGWNANAVALKNAAPLSPWWDAGFCSVMAPTLPAPFINPPLLLRTAALHPALFAPGFRYREGLLMRDGVERMLGPLARWLPSAALVHAGLGGTSRAAQWSAAATLAAPLAALSAAAGQSSSLARQALKRLIELVGPKPGEGPGLEQLDGMGYELVLRLKGEQGGVLHARLTAQGHPGYRSTPEMMACVGLALAAGELGQGRAGLLSPAAAFGSAALPLLAAAGVNWNVETP